MYVTNAVQTCKKEKVIKTSLFYFFLLLLNFFFLTYQIIFDEIEFINEINEWNKTQKISINNFKN